VPWQRTPSTAAVPSAAAVRSSTTSSGAATNGRAARPDVDPTTAETGGAPIAGVVEDDASAISIEEALAVLGVSIGAEKATIEQAFHRLALTCHPDKVAHLDPDFAVLAARKFRRLQAARELLLNE
jgi:DnaJ-domain-containing protein 1